MPAVQPGAAIREYYRGNLIDLGYAATLTTLGVEVVRWHDGAGNLREVHHLYDDEDPNGSTNYDAAPIGSIYSNISTGKQFTKTSTTVWETITSA